MVLGTIRDGIKSYYNELPTNIIPSVCRSALYSFSVSFILVGVDSSKTIQLTRPLIVAGIAGTAALIHALTNPIFNYIFENQEIRWYQEAIRFVIDLTLTNLLLKQVTAFKVNEMAFQRTAAFLFSTHVARIGIDLTVNLIGIADQGAVANVKDWLREWGIGFETDLNPTYLSI